MQNTSPTAARPGGNSTPSWGASAPPNQYHTHQRSPNNPRPQTAPYPNATTSDSRRDVMAGQMYTGSEGFSYQQGAGYSPVNNVGYGYGSGGLSMPSYNATSSPSAPSSSRRASAANPASSPTVSTPREGANLSPGSRYYSHTGEGSAGPSVPPQTQYQSSSASHLSGSHHPTPMQDQPQTAHSYGGYYTYFDPSQQHHQSPGQWSHHLSQHSFAQVSPSTAQQSTPPFTTAKFTQNSAVPDQQYHRSSAGGTTSTYEYPSTATPYTAVNHDPSRGPWQAPGSGSRGSHGAPLTMHQQAPWPGYSVHHSVPIPPHMINGQGQYSWQQEQWNPQYGYPPTSSHLAHPPPSLSMSGMIGGKKSKNHRKGEMEDYSGLGKRSTEFVEDEEAKRRKGVKEEEKLTPKLPAKSQLHPPRQAQSAWQLFFTDELNKAKVTAALETSPGGTPQHVKLNVAQIAKDAGAAYAALDDERREYYADKVQESKEQYAKDLAEWQATLTPEDIRTENTFRAQQRKEGKSRKGNLKDPNAPKKPLSAYFLFLKGIREDEDLRANVWGQETETTKQSVLAAERWRGLSVDEKKPYLQQAEKDKQDYESARRLYEEDAAARARGEDVPPRPIVVPEPVVNLGIPRARRVVKKEEPIDIDVKEPNFGDFSHGTPEDHSLEVEDYQAFPNTLEDLDLSTFRGVAAPGDRDQEVDWELGNLMGDGPEDAEDIKPTAVADSPSVAKEDVSMPAVVVEAAHDPIETEETSVAPTVAEAFAETTLSTELKPAATSEAVVRDFAAAAEGSLPVPSELATTLELEPSGVPTEEVSELPPAGMPLVIDEFPGGVIEQVKGDDVRASKVGTAERRELPVEEDASTVGDAVGPSRAQAEDPTTAGPTSAEVDRITADPAGSLDTVACAGEAAPEAMAIRSEDPVSNGRTAFDPFNTDEITTPACERSDAAHTAASPPGPPPEEESVTAAPATANGEDHPLEDRDDAPTVDGV